MLTIVLGVVGLIVGFIAGEENALLGVLAGVALGQALSAKQASQRASALQAELSGEVKRHEQTLQRVENAMLWMWHDWQRAKAEGNVPGGAAAATTPDAQTAGSGR